MKKLVLVVDDERDILEIVRHLVEGDGVKVEVAKNGAMAMEKIAAMKPDLIVLDLMLPMFSGVDILAQMNGKAGSPIPVIVLTAITKDSAACRQAAAFPNVVAVLVKPCSNEELKGAILKAVAA